MTLPHWLFEYPRFEERSAFILNGIEVRERSQTSTALKIKDYAHSKRRNCLPSEAVTHPEEGNALFTKLGHGLSS